jgi:CDP-diacylglycerol--glycerol-3-phosphate 3-phosphatidyltransferase
MALFARASLPNRLTVARLACVPIALLVMVVAPDAHAALLAIFLFASATDFLDGYLARRWQVVSALGTMLDPLADKLLVALLLIYLVSHTQTATLPVMIILLREIYVSGLREWLGNRQITLPVSGGGKWKTALQLVAIALLLASPVWQVPALMPLGNFVLMLAAALAFFSAVAYTRQSMNHFKA